LFQGCFVDDAVGGANEGFNCAALGRRILLMNMSSVHAAVWYMTLANIDRGSWFVAARTSHRQQSPVIQSHLDSIYLLRHPISNHDLSTGFALYSPHEPQP
jgi:hypothetical protein